MKIIHYLILLLIPVVMFSQETFNGKVQEMGTEMPVPGANVYWLNTEVGTITDFNGEFSIPYKKDYKKLVISFMGYTSDTLSIKNNQSELIHKLSPSANLDEVDLVSRKKATSRSYLESTNVMNISSDELLKAACCNLSESFETNPSIDVNFADAISGTRQIKMLGLTVLIY